VEIVAAMFGPEAERPSAGLGEVETPLIPAMDGFLGLLRVLRRWPQAFETYESVLARLGLIGMLLAGAVALFHLTIVAIKTDSMYTFLVGLGAAVGAVVVHYVSARFLNAARTLLRDNPKATSAEAFMDSMALVMVVATIALIVLAVVVGAMYRTFAWVVPTLAGAVVAAHIMFCFLNPAETLNVRGGLRGAGAGEAALAIVTVLLRCLLVAAPLLLALGILGGTSAMVFIMVISWTGTVSAIHPFTIAGLVVGGAALAPVALYLGYVFVMVVVDFFASIYGVERNTRRITK
jgi:hypothetical protein